MFKQKFKTYDELPLMLSVQDLAAFLGVSRSSAYALMHSDSFPALHVGKRLICPRERLFQWLDNNIAAKSRDD